MKPLRRDLAAAQLLAELAGLAQPPARRSVPAARRARLHLLRAGLDERHPPAPLDPDRLRAGLGQRASIDLRWGCPSTLDSLRLLPPSLPHVVISEWQWAGRGRQTRRWLSPLSGNYYIGLACRLPPASARLSTLPLLLGVAVAEGLRALQVPVQLKWPNDLMVGERKLGGLLVELAQQRGELVARIGVGLNWRLAHPLRQQIDRVACDLSELMTTLPDRTALLLDLLHRLLDAVDALVAGRSGQWLARWRQLDCLHGRQLQVSQAGELIKGVADSVDASGRLRLRSGDAVRLLDAAEVRRVWPQSAAES